MSFPGRGPLTSPTARRVSGLPIAHGGPSSQMARPSSLAGSISSNGSIHGATAAQGNRPSSNSSHSMHSTMSRRSTATASNTSITRHVVHGTPDTEEAQEGDADRIRVVVRYDNVDALTSVRVERKFTRPAVIADHTPFPSTDRAFSSPTTTVQYQTNELYGNPATGCSSRILSQRSPDHPGRASAPRSEWVGRQEHP